MQCKKETHFFLQSFYFYVETQFHKKDKHIVV